MAGRGRKPSNVAGGGLFDQYMAQHGYVVFKLDNRGSARRERKFTDVIYRNLGKHEVEDQLAGIDWLAKQTFVDARRVGVFGWSYGGFMTLRLLEAGSDRIALGAAVAPVTDWHLYDTHSPSNSLIARKIMPKVTRKAAYSRISTAALAAPAGARHGGR